jgi:hypothetical protein
MRAFDIPLTIAVLFAPIGARAQAPAAAAPPPAHHHRHHHAIYHRKPPVPPPSPEGAPQASAGTSPAPVPNENIGPPQAPPEPSTQIDPGTLHIHYPPLGNGYLPGSSPQDMANTQTPQVPGVTVKIPLQQGQPQPLPPPGQGP